MKFRLHTGFYRCICFHLYILQSKDILKVNQKKENFTFLFSANYFLVKLIIYTSVSLKQEKNHQKSHLVHLNKEFNLL